uniref:Uncharacterized protein n=1 Tax=Panagrolaimus superbus TaxID=310955 RepID=A0A914YWW4_9BILA
MLKLLLFRRHTFMMSSVYGNHQQTDDQLLIVHLKREVERKREELERLKMEHTKEQGQQEIEYHLYTKHYKMLCDLVRSNGMNLEQALNSDYAEDRERKRNILDLRRRIHLANEKRQGLMQKHRQEEYITKKKEEEFEKIKLSFSKDAKNPAFRDHAEKLGVHFTRRQTDRGKYVYIPNFTKDFDKHNEFLKEKLPHNV